MKKCALRVRKCPYVPNTPDWAKFGKAAGPIRNKTMAENGDALIAVWDGTSRGTKSMIDLAQKLGLKVFIYKSSQLKSEKY